MSPDRLAEAILGEVEAALFENLYAAYHRDALRLARSMVGDPDLAVDVVHTAYLEILRFLLSGRRWFDPDKAKTAVLRHTRWAAHKALRRRQRLIYVDVPAGMNGDADASIWAEAEARALCQYIIGQLDTRHRRAIEARYVDDLSNASAAARLGISEKAFETRLFRALAAARKLARGSGLASLAWPLGSLRDLMGRSARRRHVRMPTLRSTKAIAATAGAVALAIPAAGMLSRLAAPDAVPPAIAAVHPAPALALAASTLSYAATPVDAVVVDATAVPEAGGTVTVVALAANRRCGCYEILRSDDGGASWKSSASPVGSAAARLPVEAAAWYARRCPCPQPARTVRFRPALDHGLLLTLSAERVLFFPSSGGVLCSQDAAATWSLGCTPWGA